MNTKQPSLLLSTIVLVALGLLLFSGCSTENSPGPHERPPNAEEESSNSGLLVAVFCLVFLGVGGVVLMVRGKKPVKGGGGAADVEHHFRCAECKKKISYSARRIGQKAQCPNCGKSFVFPAPPPLQPPKKLV